MLVLMGIAPAFRLQKTEPKANLKKLGIRLLGGVASTRLYTVFFGGY
jgi:hypothetical protein